MHDDLGASFAADNRAFHVGRPAGISPSTCEEKVGNGASLKRTADLGSGREGKQDGLGRFLREAAKRLIRGKKFERTKKARRFLSQVRRRIFAQSKNSTDRLAGVRRDAGDPWKRAGRRKD